MLSIVSMRFVPSVMRHHLMLVTSDPTNNDEWPQISQIIILISHHRVVDMANKGGTRQLVLLQS
jgi:hypothetical protein